MAKTHLQKHERYWQGMEHSLWPRALDQALTQGVQDFIDDTDRRKAWFRDWSLTSLRDRMIKIGAKAVRHARSIILQLAEVAVPRDLWAEMLATIAGLKAKAQSP